MKRILRSVPILMLLIIGWNQVYSQPESSQTKSVALILKMSGEDKVVQAVDIYQTDIFEGKAKNLYGRSSVRSLNPIHIIVESEKKVLIEAYFDNPLDLKLESFQPDGTIERGEVVNEHGFVNLRLPLPSSAGTLTFTAYQLNTDGTERLISTFQKTYNDK